VEKKITHILYIYIYIYIYIYQKKIPKSIKDDKTIKEKNENLYRKNLKQKLIMTQ